MYLKETTANVTDFAGSTIHFTPFWNRNTIFYKFPSPFNIKHKNENHISKLLSERILRDSAANLSKTKDSEISRTNGYRRSTHTQRYIRNDSKR